MTTNAFEGAAALTAVRPRLADRLQKKRRFRPTALLRYVSCGAVALSMAALLCLVGFVLVKGLPRLDAHFLFGKHSSARMSVLGPFFMTLKIVLVSLLITVPVGTCCAIYLVEYTGRGNRLVRLIRTATETLAGVPSIVFGLFGLIFFVDMMGLGRSVWAGALTVSLMILPTVVTAVEESLRAVPDAYREGAFGLGASKLRTVFSVVVPGALSGIVSAVILGMGRIVSESAPLLFTAGTNITSGEGFSGGGATLAVAMYMEASSGGLDNAYGIAVVLIALVVGLNLLASLLSARLSKKFGEER